MNGNKITNNEAYRSSMMRTGHKEPVWQQLILLIIRSLLQTREIRAHQATSLFIKKEEIVTNIKLVKCLLISESHLILPSYHELSCQ